MIAVAGGILIVLAILALAFMGLIIIADGKAAGWWMFLGAVAAAVWVVFV